MSLVELAPRHKRGLTLRGPVLNAAGTLGFAVEAEGVIDLEALGGFVTNPFTFESRGPAGAPNAAAVPGGVVLHTGLPNPGVKAGIRRFALDWDRVFGRRGVPVIVHLAATRTHEVRRAVELIERVDVVAGLELGLREDSPPAEFTQMIHAARGNLPLVVRLPLDRAEALAPLAVRAGADALCIGAPPRWRPMGQATEAQPRSGRLYGSSVRDRMLAGVAAVAALGLDVPLLAGGGVMAAADVAAARQAGAVAVQADLTIWRGRPLAPEPNGDAVVP